MNPATVIDLFTYEENFYITGRGCVLTGKVTDDARKVHPGMILRIDEISSYKIVGVEKFQPMRPTLSIGLLLRRFRKEDAKLFSKGDEFSILEKK